MKNFLRVVQLTLSRRVTFVAAVACSLGVAFFWGGNLALIKPVIEIVFSDQQPHALIDQKVTDAQEKLVATIKELAQQVVDRQFPSNSKNLGGMVETRVSELLRKGILRRTPDKARILPGKTANAPVTASIRRTPAATAPSETILK